MLFIDASKECVKVTNNNKLSTENMDHIEAMYANRAEVTHIVHVASIDEIVAADYNLSVSTYVEAEDTREKIDITKFNTEIEKIVCRENVLRAEIEKIIEEANI